MRIGIIGTGMVGQALAGRLAELGHHVTVGTRDPQVAMSRRSPDAMGNPGFGDWHDANPGVTVATFTEAAAQADVVINATSGGASLTALDQAGATALANKVLIDVANPLDFSQGFPPFLSVKDTDSLGEQIQASFPESRVVKTLNTMNASVMVDPNSVGAGDHTVFMAGNDSQAKATVAGLLTDLGHRDIVDLGDITGARGTEMMMPIWLRLYGTLGTPMIQFKVVR